MADKGIIFSAPMVLMSATIAITGRRWGRVTTRCFCHRLAPSTSAASYS